MPFLGTIANIIAVLLGSLIGLFAGERMPDRIQRTVMDGLGLGTILIGLSMALETRSVVAVVGALLIGGVLGAALSLESRLNLLGEKLKHMVGAKSPRFVEGWVDATLLFCVGPITFIGSIQDGLGDNNLMFIKAMLDGFASIALASALGIGVLFSLISILIVQGGIAAASMAFGEFADPAVINEISAVGGLMIMGIGINLMNLKKIPVANFLPALLMIIPLAVWLMQGASGPG